MINVNFPAMRQAADDTRTCHNALVQEKDGLEQFLTKLTGTWGGNASGNWQNLQGEWNTACDDVQTILLHLYNSLEVALHNYTQTEHYLEQLWGA
jgi:WXG100 family type VII secretion target